MKTETTDYKNRRAQTLKSVKEDFEKLMSRPGAMKTAVYKTLAQKYQVTERTIMNYLNT